MVSLHRNRITNVVGAALDPVRRPPYLVQLDLDVGFQERTFEFGPWLGVSGNEKHL